MVDPDLFNDVPIFALLDAEERLVLAQQVSLHNFTKGETVFRAGDPGGHAYIVQRGRVHITLTDVAKDEVLVDVCDDGHIFGMSSLLAEADHLTTAVAVEDTQAIEIDRNDIVVLIQKKPLAGLDMMAMIEKQLRSTHELMRTRVSRNPNEEMEEKETLGDRLSDAVARFGGSWKFISAFAVFLAIYVLINLSIDRRWDPYPFILLNLFLSMLAAVQAPIIMMSQNRQDAKDRLRNELDYRCNLKAELEIEEVLHRMTRLEQRLASAPRRPA